VEAYIKFSEVYGKKRYKGDECGVMDIYNELKDLFLNAYEWEGLPPSVDERYLNLQLFLTGKVAFFKSDFETSILNTDDPDLEQGNYLVGKPLTMGELGIYGEPKKVNVMFRNGGNAGTYLNKKELVIIYHSLARDIPQIRLWEYANKIWHEERTIDHNVNGQKTPWLIGTTQRQLNTIKKIFQKIMRFEDTIYVSKDLDKDNLVATDIRTPYVADKIFDLRKNWYNEALSYIGIESNMSEKSERLLRGELFVSNGKAIARRNSMLKARKLAAKQINSIWSDLNIDVIATNPSIMDIMGEGEEVEPTTTTRVVT